MSMNRKNRKNVFAAVGIPILAVVVLLGFGTALSNLQQGKSEEGMRQLERAIQRAVVTCYVTEGIYPPDIEYLQENYGIQIDEKRYTVMYDVFASNLMPDITVLQN